VKHPITECDGVAVLVVYRCEECGRVWATDPPDPNDRDRFPPGLDLDPRHDPIAILDLSTRAYNCLTVHGGIRTIGELTTSNAQDLLKIKNLGRVTLRELVDRLRERGLALRRVPGDEWIYRVCGVHL